MPDPFGVIRFEFHFSLFRVDESIYHMRRPFETFRRVRWRHVSNRLETPPLHSLFEDRLPRRRFFKFIDRWRIIAWIGCPHGNPLLEVRNDAIVQFRSTFGHLQAGQLVSQNSEQATFLRFPRNNHHSSVAASEHPPRDDRVLTIHPLTSTRCGTNNTAQPRRDEFDFQKTRPAPWSVLRPTSLVPHLRTSIMLCRPILFYRAAF